MSLQYGVVVLDTTPDLDSTQSDAERIWYSICWGHKNAASPVDNESLAKDGQGPAEFLQARTANPLDEAQDVLAVRSKLISPKYCMIKNEGLKKHDGWQDTKRQTGGVEAVESSKFTDS